MTIETEIDEAKTAIDNAKCDIANNLHKDAYYILNVFSELYDSEINFSLSTFWDGGYKVKFGDTMNGFKDESYGLRNMTEVADELIRMAILHYPKSNFANIYAKK